MAMLYQVAEAPESCLPSAWAKAHAEFTQDLTPAERVIYQSASFDTIIGDVNRADLEIKNSRSRRFFAKINPFVNTIQRYGSALDVLSNTFPIALAPLWGGIRIILYLADHFKSYFENLIELIAQINEYLPQFTIYEKLFSSHERVSKAVTAAFLEVLTFCKDVKRVLRNQKKIHFKLLWRSFEQDFKIEVFHKHHQKVTQEVDMAHIIDSKLFRESSVVNQNTAQAQSVEDREWRVKQARNAFLATLDICAYEQHKELIPKPALGTCQWLLKHDHFRNWLQGDISLLYVELGPAMGKSVLARSIVDFLDSDDVVDIPETKCKKKVCYFFFSDKDDSRRDARFAISALLHQLLLCSPLLLTAVLENEDDVASRHHWTHLWNTFCTLLVSKQKMQLIWVLDGLDECDESCRSEFTNSLVSLLNDPVARPKLKVVITSRPSRSILDAINSECSNPARLVAVGHDERDRQRVQAEVGLFIDAKVDQFRALRSKITKAGDDVSKALYDWIILKENPNYLWVSFIFKELEKNAALSKDDLRDIIETLPDSCSDFYERILAKSPYPEKAKMVLHAVAGAARPLTIDEMNHVLSLRRTHCSIGEVSLIPRASLETTLQELCGFFIRVVNNRIYLIHQTAQEFLLRHTSVGTISASSDVWKHSLQVQRSHELLGRACIQYLLFTASSDTQSLVHDDFLTRDLFSDYSCSWADDHAQDFNTIDAYSKTHPFFQYAACHWHEHLQNCNAADAEALLPMALQICDVETQTWKTWFAVFLRNWTRAITVPPFSDTLIFSAWFGFAQGVKTLLDQHVYSDNGKALAIAIALQRKHFVIVKLIRESDFPKRSRARRLQEMDAVLKQVEAEFRDADPDTREWIDQQLQMLRDFREHLVEEMELAADARNYPA